MLELQRKVTGALEPPTERRTDLTAIRRALLDSSADAKLIDDAAALDKRLTSILRKLRGDETLRGLESGSTFIHPEPHQLGRLRQPQLDWRPDRHAATQLSIASEEFTVEQPQSPRLSRRPPQVQSPA